MTPESEKILAMCEFDEDELRETSYELGYHDGGREENARLLPIIKALLSDRDRLREACQLYATRANWEYIEGHTKWASNFRIQDCAMYNAGGGKARLALTASQATDDLILKGRKE